MQKLLRRTAQAQRHARHKVEQQALLEQKRDRRRHRRDMREVRAADHEAYREARNEWKEDYTLGPLLAPWRNNPIDASTRGLFPDKRIRPIAVAERDRVPVEDWFVRVGDRVVVTAGREHVKGRIGTIRICNEESQTVVIDGIPRLEIDMGAYMAESNRRGHLQAEPIPISNIRLVYPLADPQTGELRDVVVSEKGLRRTNERYNHYRARKEWDRVLWPQNILLEWPEEKQRSYVTEDADTPQDVVLRDSFDFPLLERIMPETVIDELRGKYSKTRKRHEPEFVERKLLEDEMAERKKVWSKVMINKPTYRPKEELVFSAQRKGANVERGSEQELRILEQLGAYIATKRAAGKSQTQEKESV